MFFENCYAFAIPEAFFQLRPCINVSINHQTIPNSVLPPCRITGGVFEALRTLSVPAIFHRRHQLGENVGILKHRNVQWPKGARQSLWVKE